MFNYEKKKKKNLKKKKKKKKKKNYIISPFFIFKLKKINEIKILIK